MHILFSEISLALIIGLLLLYFRLRIKKLKTYQSPLTGTIIVWEKYNKERLLTTNGFSQGVSVGDRSITKSYWHYQAEQIIKNFHTKKVPTVLWLGLGAGTGPHIVARKNPSIHQTVIEFDQLIIKAAKEFFSIDSIPNVSILQADAYKEIKRLGKEQRTFDAVIADIYVDDDPENGKNSANKDFLRDVSKLLKPGGLLIFNRLAHTEDERKRTKQLIQALEQNFKSVKCTFIKDPRGYQNEVIIVLEDK